MPEIHLNEEHVYTVDGQVRLGVTSVLRPLEDWYGIPASVLEYASERGRAVHAAIDLYHQDDLDMDSLDPAIAPYFHAYQQFLSETKFEPKAVEQRVFHEIYGYAGTLDLHGVLHGLKGSPEAIIDTKCVARVSPVTGLQTAAYVAAYNADRRRKFKRYALQLKPDGTYRLHSFAERSDFDVFIACLSIANFKARHNMTKELG